MGLGPVIGTLQLTIGGQPADEVYMQLDKAINRAINFTEQFIKSFKVDIPRATGSLLSSFHVEKNLYWPKMLRFFITSDYAQYVLQFGREAGKRPPWEKIKHWALVKGIDLRKARAWWWAHGREGKSYRSRYGQSLTGWWDRKVLQFKYFFERELRNQLQAIGFDPNSVKLTVEEVSGL